MAEYDDWFNVDDDGFQEKLQENREITTLFTDKSLLLPPFMSSLGTIFGIETKDVKKIISILKRYLKGFFSGEKELDWETISAQDRATVIKKDVKLIEGFNMPQLLGHVDLWKSPNIGMDLQSQSGNLSSSSSTSSSSPFMPNVRNVNAAANS